MIEVIERLRIIIKKSGTLWKDNSLNEGSNWRMNKKLEPIWPKIKELKVKGLKWKGVELGGNFWF